MGGGSLLGDVGGVGAGCAGGAVFVVEGETAEFRVRFQIRTYYLRYSYRTEDETATGGEDYSPVEGTVEFAPGDTSRTVSLATLPDDVSEGHETFRLMFDNLKIKNKATIYNALHGRGPEWRDPGPGELALFPGEWALDAVIRGSN